VPLLQKLLGFAGFGSSSERRPTRHFAHLKPETAKPSATRSQRLCLRPPTLPSPPIPSSGIRQGYRTETCVGVRLVPAILPRLRGRPVRPAQHSAIKRTWLCFPSNAYCERERSAGNQLPWSERVSEGPDFLRRCGSRRRVLLSLRPLSEAPPSPASTS
jgi:hypothetical protein